ncbi:hypothetical protein, partial [Bacteroides heparinolyticus]|uniref:hypothetical protein n=1 Tax=Prevotella heparinolytica TaxID=28113 RepID=UPI0035A04D08
EDDVPNVATPGNAKEESTMTQVHVKEWELADNRTDKQMKFTFREAAATVREHLSNVVFVEVNGKNYEKRLLSSPKENEYRITNDAYTRDPYISVTANGIVDGENKIKITFSDGKKLVYYFEYQLRTAPQAGAVEFLPESQNPYLAYTTPARYRINMYAVMTRGYYESATVYINDEKVNSQKIRFESEKMYIDADALQNGTNRIRVVVPTYRDLEFSIEKN